jgi:hypothetical protein
VNTRYISWAGKKLVAILENTNFLLIKEMSNLKDFLILIKTRVILVLKIDFELQKIELCNLEFRQTILTRDYQIGVGY